MESFSRLRPICWGVAHIFVVKATGSLYSQLSWQKLFIKTRTVGAKPHSLWCFASPPPIPGWNLKARNGKIRRKSESSSLFTQIWANPRHLIAFEFFLSDKPKPLYTNFGIPLSSTSPGWIHQIVQLLLKSTSDNKTCGKSWKIYNSAEGWGISRRWIFIVSFTRGKVAFIQGALHWCRFLQHNSKASQNQTISEDSSKVPVLSGLDCRHSNWVGSRKPLWKSPSPKPQHWCLATSPQPICGICSLRSQSFKS